MTIRLPFAIGLLLATSLSAQSAIPELYSLRAKGRAAVTAPVTKAIGTGLAWLAKHQEVEGYWDPEKFMRHDPVGFKCTGAGKPAHRVGVTGMALLAFLADDNTLAHGHYKQEVERGIDWLVKQQSLKGQSRGLIGTAASHKYIYDHLFATYALLEAHGLSRSTELGAKLSANVKAAVDYIQRQRHPDFAWRYKPGQQDGDTPVTVLAFVVLRMAKEIGFAVADSHAVMTARFLARVTSEKGLTGYHKVGVGSSRRPGDHATHFPAHESPTLTAASLACRFLLDSRLDESPLMQRQAAIVAAHPPAKPDFYYWYYGATAMHQVGGEKGAKWLRAVRGALLARQRKSGSSKGSWDADTVWGLDGGRVYTTAIGVLTLQTEYRYARLSESAPVSRDLSRFGLMRRRWIKRDFGGVLRARKALLAEPAGLNAEEKAALERFDAALDQESSRALERVAKLENGPDYEVARTQLAVIAKSFHGLSAGTEARSMLQVFANSKGIQREIAAMSAYRRALRRTRGRHQALLKVAKTYEGTGAATMALNEMIKRPR